jgi:hypothetical protein
MDLMFVFLSRQSPNGSEQTNLSENACKHRVRLFKLSKVKQRQRRSLAGSHRFASFDETFNVMSGSDDFNAVYHVTAI